MASLPDEELVLRRCQDCGRLLNTDDEKIKRCDECERERDEIEIFGE